MVADYEDQVGLAAYTHPPGAFHLGEDCLLQRQPSVAESLWTKAPEQWIPVEADAVIYVEGVIGEKHGVKGDHVQEVTRVLQLGVSFCDSTTNTTINMTIFVP